MRDAEGHAHRFVAEVYPGHVHWHFNICEEELERARRGAKVWPFDLTPDEEDDYYEPERCLVGYVHVDGAIERMYR